MKIKQTQLNHFAKTKYSEIPGIATGVEERARIAMGYLMQYGYACMSGHAINEVLNLIRSLRELKIEYTMKVVQGQPGNVRDTKIDNFYYEFTLGFFEDDRDVDAK